MSFEQQSQIPNGADDGIPDEPLTGRGLQMASSQSWRLRSNWLMDKRSRCNAIGCRRPAFLFLLSRTNLCSPIPGGRTRSEVHGDRRRDAADTLVGAPNPHTRRLAASLSLVGRVARKAD